MGHPSQQHMKLFNKTQRYTQNSSVCCLWPAHVQEESPYDGLGGICVLSLAFSIWSVCSFDGMLKARDDQAGHTFCKRSACKQSLWSSTFVFLSSFCSLLFPFVDKISPRFPLCASCKTSSSGSTPRCVQFRARSHTDTTLGGLPCWHLLYSWEGDDVIPLAGEVHCRPLVTRVGLSHYHRSGYQLGPGRVGGWGSGDAGSPVFSCRPSTLLLGSEAWLTCVPFSWRPSWSVLCRATSLMNSTATELTILILNGCASGPASHMLIAALNETLMTRPCFNPEQCENITLPSL